MKVTKKNLDKLRTIIREELEKASPIAELFLKEEGVFKNKNRMLPSEWEEFQQSFLSKNSDHKVVSGKDGSVSFEAIVSKSQPRQAIIKYIPKDMDVYHDLRSSEFFKYLR